MTRYYGNVEGAPFQIGQRVRFIGRIDETCDNQGLGEIGVIDCLMFDSECGDSFPDDPCVSVRGLPGDFYWAEELEVVPAVQKISSADFTLINRYVITLN